MRSIVNKERKPILGGDPNVPEQEQAKICSLSQKVSGFLVNGVYGRYDPKTREWIKVKLPENKSSPAPSAKIFGDNEQIVSVKLAPEASQITGEINLPYLLGASPILTDRIGMIDHQKQKKAIAYQKNQYGEVVIENIPHAGQITYSFEYNPERPFVEPRANLTAKELDKFYSKIDPDLTAEIIKNWPAEIKLFFKKINGLPPVEKLKTIESYLREIFYYDSDNPEIEPLKRRAENLAERMMIMRERMKEVEQKSGDKNKAQLAGKKYAGICADFAEIGAALLRSAGFASGIINGFNIINSAEVKSGDAHGVDFVMLPDANNQLRPIPVDFTPGGGITAEEQKLLNNLRLPDLAAREELARKYSQKETTEKMDKLMKLSAEEVAALENGEVEKLLNVYLSGANRVLDARTAETIIDAYLYSGVRGESDEAIKKELADELRREKEAIKKEADNGSHYQSAAGADLIAVISDFHRRLLKRLPPEQAGESWEVAKKIFELAKDELAEKEYRGIVLAFKYLSTLGKSKE